MTEPSISRALIQDRRIVILGKLGSMTRREARELIRQAGGLLVDRLGDEVDMVVVGADQIFLDQDGAILDQWLAEEADPGTIEIVSEANFCQSLGLVDEANSFHQLYTPAMLADLLKLPLATIRRWHRRGLIHPVRKIKRLPYFDFQEVATARRLAKLIASGASAQLIEAKLTRLAELYPELNRPLSQLSVIVEGKGLLLRQGEGLIEPCGQMRLIYEEDSDVQNGPRFLKMGNRTEERVHKSNYDHETSVSTTKHCQSLTTPDEYIELAIEFEDQRELNSAIEIFRAMMLALGPTSDSCFRIAELLYQSGDLSAARERYYVAIELDESHVEARASLGCVLMELGQNELAYSAFKGALVHHEDYPDVHFHLARLLDEMDRVLEAEFHWKYFLKLAPKSPWADEARQRLSR